MKRWLVLALCGASVAFGQSVQVLRLDEAVAIAKRQSRSLQIAAARAEGAAAKAGEARSNRWASVRVSAGYLKVSQGDFTLPVALPPALIAALGPHPFAMPVVSDTYALRAALQQPLFTGSRISSAVRAAELGSMAADLDRDMAMDDLVLGVSTAYWSLYQSLETKKFMGENVARLKSYVSDTERLVQTGLATKSDLLKIQVQLANAEVQEIDATNDATLAAMNLNLVIGQPVDTEILPGSSPDELLQADSLAAAGSTANDLPRVLDARKDYRAAGLMRDAAQEAVHTATASYWPQIDLSAGYNYNRPNARYQPVTPEFLGSWDVGVQLSMDLWNWGRTARQAEQAEAAVRQSEQQLAQMKDNIALEVSRASLGKHRAAQKVSVARLGVSQAEEHLRTTNDRYRTGLAPSSELLDAEVALLQAKTTLSGAAVEFAIAAARLSRATGAGR